MAKNTTAEQRAAQSRANGKLGGRPPKYKTAFELETAIDNYFESCDTNGSIPTWADMLIKLKISDRTLLNYRTAEEYIKQGYCDAIKKAEQLHCHFWQQYAVTHPNLQSFCIFELKQPHNGGFADKQQIDSNNKHEIEINIKGV